MNKSHQTSTRAHSRRFVDEACPFVFQFRKRGVYVRDLNCNMMHSRSAFSEKLSHGRFGTQWLEQLDMSVTNSQHAYLDTLLGNFLSGVNFESECIAPNCQTFFDAPRSDSDVINFQQTE